METLKFEVQKMFVLPDAGSLKAFADVVVNDQMVIRGIRILEGKKGLFVDTIKEQGKDGKWYDQVSFTNELTWQAMADAVLTHYHKQKGA
jgi:stage V sporulation protein G